MLVHKLQYLGVNQKCITERNTTIYIKMDLLEQFVQNLLCSCFIVQLHNILNQKPTAIEKTFISDV